MTPADLDRAIDQVEQIIAQVDHTTYEQSMRLYGLSVRVCTKITPEEADLVLSRMQANRRYIEQKE